MAIVWNVISPQVKGGKIVEESIVAIKDDRQELKMQGSQDDRSPGLRADALKRQLGANIRIEVIVDSLNVPSLGGSLPQEAKMKLIKEQLKPFRPLGDSQAASVRRRLDQGI